MSQAGFTRFDVSYEGTFAEGRVFQVYVTLETEYPFGESQRQFIEQAIKEKLERECVVPQPGKG